MRLDIHLHHHADPVDTRVTDKLDLILAYLENIMPTIDDIVADVARESTLVDSVLALVTSLKSQVADALSSTKLPPDVDAKLAAIFPTLEANIAKLTGAITANTEVAAPAPVADPAPATTTDVSGAGDPPSQQPATPTTDVPASAS